MIFFLINSCKDSLGVDPNVLKNSLNGDTIRLDTTFINFKKVIIREIVRQNDTTIDTVYIDTAVPLSEGRINAFAFNFLYNYQHGQGQIKTFQIKVSDSTYFNELEKRASIDYNDYLPVLNFEFFGNFFFRDLIIPQGLDSLVNINFNFSKLNILDILTSNNLNYYFQTGSKADFNVKLPLDDSIKVFSGQETHFQMFGSFIPDSITGKIMNLRLDFAGQIAITSDSTQIGYTGFFNIVFK